MIFGVKSHKERDAILQSLGEDRLRFNLAHNGESDLARALVPMVRLKSKAQLPNSIAAHILSFLKPNDKKKQTDADLFTDI